VGNWGSISRLYIYGFDAALPTTQGNTKISMNVKAKKIFLNLPNSTTISLLQPRLCLQCVDDGVSKREREGGGEGERKRECVCAYVCEIELS